MKRLCDTHCHLYLDEFKEDLNAVIHRAVQAGVSYILVPGIDYQSSIAAVELSEKYAGVLFPAVGIHPNYSSKAGIEDINQLRVLIENNPSIRAIGEIGLDFYRTWSSHEDQYFIFKEMLKLSEEFNLPICLHVRDSSDEILKVLDPWYTSLLEKQHPLVDNPGVFHSFDGNDEVAQWAVNHHFKFGVSGTVTYKKAQSLRDALSNLDPKHLIIETDAPYLSPHPYRGKRNEPAYVKFTADKLAEILSLNPEEIYDSTSRNAAQLFRWKDA